MLGAQRSTRRMWKGQRRGQEKMSLAAVVSGSAIGSDAVRTLKDPIADAFANAWPKEAEVDSVQGFVNSHVALG